LPRVATRLARFLACFSYWLSPFNRRIGQRQANCLANLGPQRSSVLLIAEAAAAGGGFISHRPGSGEADTNRDYE
jgi:hypothetical protein